MRVLILVTVWPEPESSAAGWRVMNVIDSMLQAGWSVCVASPSSSNVFSERLAAKVLTHPVALNDSSFDGWVARVDFDIAILDRFIIEEQFGWRIAEHSPRTMRVLDTEDLHFLRRARQEALRGGTSLEKIFDDQIPLDTDDSLREIASIYRSDLTLVLSSHEMALLQTHFDVCAEHLLHFPFCYAKPAPTPELDERQHFVSIGNFRHPPNADAVRWLKDELWMKIRAALAPEMPELHLYGAYPPREISALHSPQDGFHVLGPAPSAHEALQRYRVSLAPLRFGAGIKGKISDSWFAGTPVVTTPIGAEGMRNPAFGGAIARTADEFAQAAAKLYRDRALWQDARSKGQAVIATEFDFESNSRRLISAMERRREHLNEHRAKNLMGRMLSHHTARSTKYFSKWLELKERQSVAAYSNDR